jgi:hypothetical protein
MSVLADEISYQSNPVTFPCHVSLTGPSSDVYAYTHSRALMNCVQARFLPTGNDVEWAFNLTLHLLGMNFIYFLSLAS